MSSTAGSSLDGDASSMAVWARVLDCCSWHPVERLWHGVDVSSTAGEHVDASRAFGAHAGCCAQPAGLPAQYPGLGVFRGGAGFGPWGFSPALPLPWFSLALLWSWTSLRSFASLPGVVVISFWIRTVLLGAAPRTYCWIERSPMGFFGGARPVYREFREHVSQQATNTLFLSESRLFFDVY